MLSEGGLLISAQMIGLPVWYIIGILVTFADHFGQAFGIPDIDPAKAIRYLYLAIGMGDFAVGWLRERLKSRKKTLYLFLGITMCFTWLYFLQRGGSAGTFYLLCMGLGFGAGFNVVYLTLSYPISLTWQGSDGSLELQFQQQGGQFAVRQAGRLTELVDGNIRRLPDAFEQLGSTGR